MPTLVESFELLVHAEQLAPRLAAAQAALAQLPGLDEEKTWLAAARARLATARADTHGALLDRALRLAELDGPARRDLRAIEDAQRARRGLAIDEAGAPGEREPPDDDGPHATTRSISSTARAGAS
jgi:hypothetical protein